MCTKEIHEELYNNEDMSIVGHFCNQVITENLDDFKPAQYEKCRVHMKIIKTLDNNKVCNRCSQTHGYELVRKFVDFYEKRHIFHKKSVYFRKYHIENTINRITRNYKINMDGEVRQKIFRIFNLINDITPKLNNGRKRMVD